LFFYIFEVEGGKATILEDIEFDELVARDVEIFFAFGGGDEVLAIYLGIDTQVL
jgi:hypothetical protein